MWAPRASLFRRFTDTNVISGPLKYGKLGTKYPWIYGYYLQRRMVQSFVAIAHVTRYATCSVVSVTRYAGDDADRHWANYVCVCVCVCVPLVEVIRFQVCGRPSPLSLLRRLSSRRWPIRRDLRRRETRVSMPLVSRPPSVVSRQPVAEPRYWKGRTG